MCYQRVSPVLIWGLNAFLLQLSDTSVLGVENIRKHEKQTVDSDPTDPLLNL